MIIITNKAPDSHDEEHDMEIADEPYQDDDEQVFTDVIITMNAF